MQSPRNDAVMAISSESTTTTDNEAVVATGLTKRGDEGGTRVGQFGDNASVFRNGLRRWSKARSYSVPK
jgi:hypothetical protein